jgi:hypothetical protein
VPRTPRLGRRVLLAAPHALAAVVLTWPLVLHLGDEIPLGTESSGTVPLFNLWTLRWNADRVAHAFHGYWDAPIFHPAAGTFALSDPQPLTGLAFAPLFAVTGNAALAYNLVLLGILALNGWAAARFCRRLGVTSAVAILAGVLAQALPFVANEVGVIQLTVLFPIFLLLTALHDWLRPDRDARRRAPATGRARFGPPTRVGLWLAVTFLTSSYYGLFVVVVLGLTVWFLLAREVWRPGRAVELVVAVVVFAVPTLPVLLAQADLTSTHHRSEETIRDNSAAVADYGQLDEGAWGDRLLPWLLGTGGSGQRLYPGTLLLGAAVGGAYAGWHGRTRRWTRFLVAFAGVAVVASLGLRLDLGGFHPYELLRDHMPGYENLRSPFRFAVLLQVALVPLAALGLDAVWRRASLGGPPVALALVGFGLLEVLALPVPLVDVPDAHDDWVDFLQDAPPGVVAMVPFPSGRGVDAFEPTVESMLAGLEHGHPLVNGYSGLFPASHDQLWEEMDTFPDADSRSALEDAGVRYVVVDRDAVSPAIDAATREELEVVFEGDDRTIYALSTSS